MASIRNLKKDIDYLTDLVVVDCLQALYYFKSIDEAAVSGIIGEIITLRDELRNRTNHPDGKDNKTISKAYYNKIGKDLVEACDNSYSKLSEIINKLTS